jgi:hypothetical protein
MHLEDIDKIRLAVSKQIPQARKSKLRQSIPISTWSWQPYLVWCRDRPSFEGAENFRRSEMNGTWFLAYVVMPLAVLAFGYAISRLATKGDPADKRHRPAE